MVDNLSKEKRSKVMSSIKGKDTKPERILGEVVDRRIFRFQPNILGRPDFGNKKRKLAVFVDGCFWHGCPLCYKEPASNKHYWSSKLLRNRGHDEEVTNMLERQGYRVFRFWEHEVRQNPNNCAQVLKEAIS
ncbi:MAG: very short patch repair endonuclease [Thermoplasmatales archaeon]|nr:very short patch repair endonuclease [Thermoplasmatales archaeon]